MSIVALLMTIALPRYFAAIERSKEVTLREDLKIMRDSLDKYYADRGSYPQTLEQLVDGRYLREVPKDPITGSAQTWVTVAPESTELDGIYDVRSGAPGATRSGIYYSDL